VTILADKFELFDLVMYSSPQVNPWPADDILGLNACEIYAISKAPAIQPSPLIIASIQIMADIAFREP
jgi:hypothetical protein